MQLKKLKKIQVCKLKETQFHKMIKSNQANWKYCILKGKSGGHIGMPCDNLKKSSWYKSYTCALQIL